MAKPLKTTGDKSSNASKPKDKRTVFSFFRVFATVLVFVLISVYVLNDSPFAQEHENTPRSYKAEREIVRRMFYHAYDGYLLHAFPKDELAPISCTGHDTHNCQGCMLTFYDALDTLAVLGNRTEYQRVVNWIIKHGEETFDRDVTVSVFETNIRILGSLISNHLLASDKDLNLMPGYNGELLTLALSLGNRLVNAYMTPTGLPYGSINLKRGIQYGETTVTATATGGTVLLEFLLLSKLTGKKIFSVVAEKATKALWERRSQLGLLGSHIDVNTGNWVYFDSGIGGGIDSFYEYLLKAYFLTGKSTYLNMFDEGYAAIKKHIFIDGKSVGWYVDVNMYTGKVMFPFYRSLQSFWPGLQALYGDVEEAETLFMQFFEVWAKYGFVPEAYNLLVHAPEKGLEQYPLRPELAESAFYLYRATGKDKFRQAGAIILSSLEKYAKVQCGYAAIENVETKKVRDHMDSYFLAETVKYLYLLFDDSPETAIFRNASKYIFNTEAHLLPLSKPPPSEFLVSPDNPPDLQTRKARMSKQAKKKKKTKTPKS
uniref:alpha-1,2-Mannosidase n=1 Tax=Guillardia theta TaxID=55529 RepID=A0A7S4PR72_GUITH|mmetsp:Transcript_9348/g.31270  ORF Transcript_9348/g.31270 Transcript_9348/m.31270 type:complete len:543 (+) Transcript_9348:27-1655(+)